MELHEIIAVAVPAAFVLLMSFVVPKRITLRLLRATGFRKYNKWSQPETQSTD
jgi:hypothetical protein